ncbi:unnamed protein product [Chrysoparadoxa australica]
MPTARFRFAGAYAQDRIFVMGGRDASDVLQCHAEYYNPESDTWAVPEETNSWAGCSSDLAAFANEDGSSLYLVGGYAADYTSLKTTTRVDIVFNDEGVPMLTYTPVADMNLIYGRGDHACQLIPGENVAYCMGGFNNFLDGTPQEQMWNDGLVSTEKYDLDADEWTTVTSMTQGRGDFALGYLNDRLTVIGGENFDGGISDIEWYDWREDCWTDSGDLFDLPYNLFRFQGATHKDKSRIYILGGQSSVSKLTVRANSASVFALLLPVIALLLLAFLHDSQQTTQINVGGSDTEVFSVNKDIHWYQEVSSGWCAGALSGGALALLAAAFVILMTV